MSKKKQRRIPSRSVCDRHHICFQKQYWNKGYAKSICMAFVRYVPVVYHRELHHLLSTVPLPPAAMLKSAWLAYKNDKDNIDSYDVCRAIAWLYVHIPDPEFRKAMQYQLDFFTTRFYRQD